MQTAAKVTFGLAGLVMVISILAISYISIRADSLEIESINAPTLQERQDADQLKWKHRGYFRAVWLLPALGSVLSFFGWIEYLKTPRGERTKGEAALGSVVTLANMSILGLYGAAFVAAGGH